MSSGKQLVRHKSGLRMLSVDAKDKSPFDVDEPVWDPDESFPNCVKCNRKFDFTHRRHHCRRCGKIFCGNCCSFKVELYRMNFVDPVRVCQDCFVIAEHEKEFFEHHLKTLTQGANFIINDTSPLHFHCKLNSKTYREIWFVCKDNAADHDPVDLLHIVSFQGVTDEDKNAEQGSSQHISGILIKYKESGEMHEVQLRAPASPESDRKQALSWISAMQRAVKMLFEVGN